MAHTKQMGSSKNLKDSNPKYLGIKRQNNQKVRIGEILIRQRGTKYLYGKNVKRGKDDTLYTIVDGSVKFSRVKKKMFNGKFRYATKVNVISVSK